MLHLDAHADLRDAYEGFSWSHASIMYNVLRACPAWRASCRSASATSATSEDALIRGNPERAAHVLRPRPRRARFDGEPWPAIAGRMVADLPAAGLPVVRHRRAGPRALPAHRHAGPGGLSFAEASALLRTVVARGRSIVGFDLNEVAPDPDGGEWDGNVGARLLYKMIGFAALVAAERRC